MISVVHEAKNDLFCELSSIHFVQHKPILDNY